MGIRPFAETLLQGVEQALRLDDLKASEKVYSPNIQVIPNTYVFFYA